MSCANSPILDYQLPSWIPIPGVPGFPPNGPFFYWPTVNALTSTVIGDEPTPGGLVILEEQSIWRLPTDALIEVKISGRGASQWLRVEDTSGPTTNVDMGGVIVPLDYDSSLRPFVLHRVAGF